jgi:alpha-L-fucosidase
MSGYLNQKSGRRSFIKDAGFIGFALPAVSPYLMNQLTPERILKNEPPGENEGAQRLTMKKLKEWESLEYGMFIHFGMSTFDGEELSKGEKPSTYYDPTQLDVDQWIHTAREAGMKYAVLTTKHVSGHCLWPTKHTDYHVGTSSIKTDVVEAFLTACAKYGIKPGFYYCSWDNHNLFGSMTPTLAGWDHAYTTQAYREFQMNQVEELIRNYGPVMEMWIDIPGVLGADGRREQYKQIASLSPDTLIMMNSGFGDGSVLKYDYAWPTDLMAIERWLPSSNKGYNPWFTITEKINYPKEYYIPGEVCDPIGYEWFHAEHDPLRSDAELLGMRLISKARNTNLLLNVPPDKRGVIPGSSVDSLIRLRKNYENFRF